MTDVASWVAAAIGVVALIVSYLSYRAQRGRTRLEYVVLTNTRLIPPHLASDLEVTHAGSPLADPTLVVVRIVNTGDRSIEPLAFETHLAIALEGATAVASASWTSARPQDLEPEIAITTNEVRIRPTLINRGDGLQLQILAAGRPHAVRISGRVRELQITQRDDLPYPPGSGAEGEMVGFDRFMWFVFSPGIIFLVGAFIAFAGDVSATARVLILAATVTVGGVLYPLQVTYLVRRRRLWRL